MWEEPRSEDLFSSPRLCFRSKSLAFALLYYLFIYLFFFSFIPVWFPSKFEPSIWCQPCRVWGRLLRGGILCAMPVLLLRRSPATLQEAITGMQSDAGVKPKAKYSKYLNMNACFNKPKELLRARLQNAAFWGAEVTIVRHAILLTRRRFL